MVIGRLLAHKIKLDGCAQLLYDPSLDDRNGYTAADGRLFDDNGQVPQAIREIETLAPQELIEASMKLNALVVANDLKNNVFANNAEVSQVDKRTSRRERRAQRRAERALKLRSIMQEKMRQFGEFAETHLTIDFQRFTSQSSMRVNSIGSSIHGNGGH